MDVESARALVAFVDAGCNLSAGGRSMGLSQPAMHARLQGLARSLAVTLYERRGQRLALTTEGATVVAWARDVLERTRTLRASLAGVASDDRLVLACGEGALVHVVAARIAAWARAHAGRLAFLLRDGPGTIEAVRRGEAHVGIVAGPASQTRDLKSEPLQTTALCAVGPRQHPVLRGNVVTIEVLLRHPLLLPPVGRPVRTLFEEAAAARNIRLQVAAELTGWEAVARLSGLGVGLGVVNDVVATRGLARALIAGVAPTTYRMLTRRGRPSADLELLLHALREENEATR